MLRRCFLLLPAFTSFAFAHSKKVGGIKIGHVWALPVLAGQDGQCFMPLFNAGKTDDALLAARSPVFLFIQLRRNARYDDPPESQFELAPNQPLAMRPQAVHLRLGGARQTLKLGDRFPLILDFLNAGEIELEVYVESTPGE
jgi:periplasmic copper chaperone A